MYIIILLMDKTKTPLDIKNRLMKTRTSPNPTDSLPARLVPGDESRRIASVTDGKIGNLGNRWGVGRITSG
jgi:hypothetical protein